MWWFWWWFLILMVLLVLPTGYGWGYRRWGPPYPSRSARAREIRAREQEASTWGVLADLLWIVLVAMIVWFVIAALA